MPTLAAPVRTKIDTLETRARPEFVWTCQHLFKIRPKDQPLIPLTLTRMQRYVAEQFLIPAHQRGIPIGLSILKARRVYMTTLNMAWLYHKIRWYRGRNTMVYAHDDDTVDEIFQMIPRFHENLPEPLQIPTSKNNTMEFGYEALDSRVARRVAGTRDVGRGKTIHHALLSELDYFANPDTILPGILEAVPSVGPSSIVFETTPNGQGGFFHEHWMALKKQRGRIFSERHWYPIFLPWYWRKTMLCHLRGTGCPRETRRS